jgi:hypothetical protein
MTRKLTTISFLLFLLVGLFSTDATAQEKQEEDHSYKPLTVKLDDSGKKYIRFILWHQQWIQTNNLAADDANLQLTHLARRSRMLAFAQVSPRFLILTHFGLNNLTPGNLTSLGNNGDAPQLFLHDAWVEYKVLDELYIGGGLHYWKGLTRLANQSTLNFMTLDNARPFIHWHSLAVTDQFARHLGVYAKGNVGKFDYRLAMNNPGRNGIQAHLGTELSSLIYSGFSITKGDDPRTEEVEGSGDPTGNTIFEGYLRYNLWDSESTKLPYAVGSYLGKKKILALGGGFFFHPNGMFDANPSVLEHQDVSHLAVDAFLDMPVAGDDCLNLYASVMRFNYGENYVSRWAGTGTAIYGQAGYLLPKTKFMPYVAFQSGNYEGFSENISALDIGVNYFINGHHAKITLEYHNIFGDPREGGFDDEGNPGDVQQIRLQGHIFL